MRPRVILQDGSEVAPAITVLIIEEVPQASTDVFRHIVRKTYDPYQRYQEGLKILSSAYYQDPETFSDVLTALFSADSAIAATLLEEGQCVLQFRQEDVSYSLPCTVEEQPPDAAPYQATYFHNRLFNHNPPVHVRVLAFRPHWSGATSTFSEKECSSPDPSLDMRRGRAL